MSQREKTLIKGRKKENYADHYDKVDEGTLESVPCKENIKRSRRASGKGHLNTFSEDGSIFSRSSATGRTSASHMFAKNFKDSLENALKTGPSVSVDKQSVETDPKTLTSSAGYKACLIRKCRKMKTDGFVRSIVFQYRRFPQGLSESQVSLLEEKLEAYNKKAASTATT